MHSDEFSISRSVRLNGKAIRQGQVAALFRLAVEFVTGDADEAEATVAFRLENGHTRTLRSAIEVEDQVFDRNVLITKVDLHASSYKAGRRIYIGLDQQPLFENGVWVSVDGEEGWVRKAFSAIEAFLSTLADVPRAGHTIGKVWRSPAGFWAVPVLGALFALGVIQGLGHLFPTGLVARGQFYEVMVIAVGTTVIYGIFINWMGRAYPEIDIVIGKREIQVRRRDSARSVVVQALTVSVPLLGLILKVVQQFR